ncbi:MAG: peptidoglycan DD-metalloendopeptidase family protein [Gemmatimonadota bacterium]
MALPQAGQEIRGRIRESQDRLDEIRDEQDRLRRERRDLASQVHTVTAEIANLEKQIGSGAAALAELDLQLVDYGFQVDETTREMLTTRDELALRRVELRQRLREIYKRGPLQTFKVLLQARSFGDLISRYKYLHLIAVYDRTLVDQVRQLEALLAQKRSQLASERMRMGGLRNRKVEEMDDLGRLERQRQQRLTRVQARETSSQERSSQLQREEARLSTLIVDLERERLEAERLAGIEPAAPDLTTADLGRLDWPVEGRIAYRYQQTSPDLAVPRRGIGILAPRGTPVTAVKDGTVQWTERRGSYGLTVFVNHGPGYWSVYLYLDELRVEIGDRVVAGQVVGTVGSDGQREQMEFQIYEPDSSGQPRQVDPERWLREQA